MHKLDVDMRAQVLAALVEGTSTRAASRVTGVARNTITALLLEAGEACAAYQDKALRNLESKRVQCDEIWSYCYSKDANVLAEKQGQFGVGSIWTWTALDADTKLICSWMVGGRDAFAAYEFMKDLAGRLANRVKLTTDGHTVCLTAVEAAFGSEIDYTTLVKIYGASRETEAPYSPAEFIGRERKPVSGDSDPKHVSTSYVERRNLTMQMHIRRFTRLTNAFSKKIENHTAAIALHFMYYNFVRIHQTLQITPAMAAGVTDHAWQIADIAALVEAAQCEREEDA